MRYYCLSRQSPVRDKKAMVMRAAALYGLFLGSAVTLINAFVVPEGKKTKTAIAGSIFFGGSAVAALLAEYGTRRKYKPIVDVEEEVRKKRALAQKELDEIDKARASADNEVRLANEHLDLLQRPRVFLDIVVQLGPRNHP